MDLLKHASAPFPLRNPALVTIPLAFAAAIVGVAAADRTSKSSDSMRSWSSGCISRRWRWNDDHCVLGCRARDPGFVICCTRGSAARHAATRFTEETAMKRPAQQRGTRDLHYHGERAATTCVRTIGAATCWPAWPRLCARTKRKHHRHRARRERRRAAWCLRNRKEPSLQVPQVAAVTDERGEYRLTTFPVGSYEVRYELSGFQTIDRTACGSRHGFVATIDVQLKVGTRRVRDGVWSARLSST